MSVYYGTIQGNTIVLPREVRLTDGLTVQVRVWPLQRPVTSQQVTSEIQFKQKLLELGLLNDLKTPSPLEEAPFVQVSGKPLSEMIIEERR